MSLLSFLSGQATPADLIPKAVAVANPSYGIVGSVVRLDGQRSQDGAVHETRSGTDSSTASPDVINIPSGGFSWIDIGKVIELTGTDAGVYRILNVVSSTQVQVVDSVDSVPLFSGGANSSWSLRTDVSYEWSFKQTPTGSSVAKEGFRVLDPSGSVVSFSPDIVGEYVISLVVSNGIFDSEPFEVRVSIRAILVPHARGLVPDGKWIWSYIRDVWSQVEGKEWFETLWSALIQIAGAEMLKTYQVDFNKSIRDIQDLYQRRWLSYEPRLALVEDDICIYIGLQEAGINASTSEYGNEGRLLILSPTEFIIVQGSVFTDVVNHTLTITYDTKEPANVGDYLLQNVNAPKNGYLLSPSSPTANDVPNRVMIGAPFVFSFQSTTWLLTTTEDLDYARRMSQYSPTIDQLVSILDPRGGSGGSSAAQVGDYIHIPSGPNQGFYRIIEKSGTFFVVDHAPPSDSDGSITANVYRPVGFRLDVMPSSTTDSFSILFGDDSSVPSLAKGRVIVVGGQTYTVLRVLVDPNRAQPLTIITTDGGVLLAGQSGMSWRVPITLYSSSQDFEELGVSPGDLLLLDVSSGEAASSASVVAQVVGVNGNRIGLVLTDEPLVPGVVPAVPNKTYTELSNKLNIPTVTVDQSGNMTMSGDAQKMFDYLRSTSFSREYYNKQLCLKGFSFKILGRTFSVHPRAIIRNSLIPVDLTLKSVPALQDWISQPEWVQRDGKTYQIKNGKEFEIRGPPLSLVENSDFIIDDETAFKGDMAFRTGTNVVSVEDGHFVDLGLRPGDQFTITSPVTISGDYFITAVLSQDSIALSSPVPLYALSEVAISKVIITRKREGKYLRFAPGGFTAANPAPPRFWAEVSLFDNSEVVEGNFGVLVGLTRQDLLNITEDINYRQAVSGLMFAYTGGSSVDLVRLGAHILLGLPFAEIKGIIRSIEEDYRLDISGNPIFGRILIEDVDDSGNALGTQRVYLYPIDQASPLAGVETNPATGKTYTVGDTVEQFAALCKGVVVDDYITNPGFASTQSPERQIQQLHAIRLRANDTIFSLSELGLVSSFLRGITPSYIRFFITTQSDFEDTVPVVDRPILRMSNRSNPVVDNASFGAQPALMLNARNMNSIPHIFLDDGVYWVRKSGKDLSTTYTGTSVTATTAAGGLITPGAGEGPVTRVGDYLYIPSGSNRGRYPITSVPDENTVLVSGLPPKGFNTEPAQTFAIVRPFKGKIRSGSDMTTVASNQKVTTTSLGLVDDGVMPGDRLVIVNGGSSSSHTIIRVGPVDAEPAFPSTPPLPAEPALLGGEMNIVPAPTASASGLTYYIFRDALLESPFLGNTGTLVSSGTSYTSLTHELYRMLEVRDELLVYDPATGEGFRLFAIDPVNGVFVPVLPAGSYNVRVCKSRKFGTIGSFNQLQMFDPYDSADVALLESKNDAAICTGTSPDVILQQWSLSLLFTAFDPLAHGVLPGDLLVLLNGGNSSVDVGYGPGVYPIKQVDSTKVTLSVNLSSNDDSAWKVIRRR